MKDWAARLRKASFRGVDFWVDAEDFSAGKRIARHEYASGRYTYLEEMGLATAAYDVTAYLIGDDSDSASQSLTSACLAAGPGRLVLPIDAGQLAYIEGFRRSRVRDRRGYIAFDFTAIPFSGQPGGALGVGDLNALVASGLGPAAGVFASIFPASTDIPSVAGWLTSAVSVLVTDDVDNAYLGQRLAASVKLDRYSFACEAMDIMRIVAESVVNPSGFDTLRLPEGSDQATLDALSILLAQGLCIAAPRVAWVTRPQARAARNRIRSVGETALAVVSAKGAVAVDLYQFVAQLVEVAVRIVSDQAADAVPVVRVETGVSLPSTVLAYRLYGRADRAGDVVDIARSGTPMLMPIAFDALES